MTERRLCLLVALLNELAKDNTISRHEESALLALRFFLASRLHVAQGLITEMGRALAPATDPCLNRTRNLFLVETISGCPTTDVKELVALDDLVSAFDDLVSTETVGAYTAEGLRMMQESELRNRAAAPANGKTPGGA